MADQNDPAVRLTYDVPKDVEAGGIDGNPCAVVPLIGCYVGRGRSNGKVHLYKDLSFRRWTEIPLEAINAQQTIEDQREGKNRTVLWVQRDATVVECHAALASIYDPQSRSLGDEDLAAEYPRR